MKDAPRQNLPQVNLQSIAPQSGKAFSVHFQLRARKL
jgi:hypothetical protein